MKKSRKVSDVLGEDVETYCEDPNAQTVLEIRKDLREAGRPYGEKLVARWIATQLANGKLKRVRVRRKNVDGVYYPVTAYLFVE